MVVTAALPVFQQRLPGMLATRGPFCDTRPYTHLGHRDTRLGSQVCGGESRVAIGCVAEDSAGVRQTP